jgi:hypothetical protein
MPDGVSDVDNADLLISKINELERNINKISKEITFKIESKKDE